MGYLYNMHCHCALVSACASITPEQIVEVHLKNGFAGVVVTDHFMNGNALVDRSKPWQKQVEEYAKGYEAVKQAAKGTDLHVLFGIETSFFGTDILYYGNDALSAAMHAAPEVFMGKPGEPRITAREEIAYMKANGVFSVQAHPFRRAGYIDHVRIFAEYVDGIEVFNSSRIQIENDLADNLANVYSLYKTAGSDIHHANLNLLGGVEFDRRPKDEDDLVALIKEGKGIIRSVKNVLA